MSFFNSLYKSGEEHSTGNLSRPSIGEHLKAIGSRMTALLKRRAVWITGLALLLIVSILLLAPLFIDVNRFRSDIESALADKWGRNVSIESVGRLRLLPSPEMEISNVRVSDDPAFSQSDFIAARTAEVRISLLPLLSGDINVKRVELTAPSVTLIKGQDGRWNWSTLKPAQDQEGAPSISIAINNGSVTLINRTQSPPQSNTYSGISLELDNFSSKTKSDFSLALTMPGENSGSLRAQGSFGPVDPKDIDDTPVNIHVATDGVELSGLEALAAGEKHPDQGLITLDADIKGRLSQSLHIRGALTASRLSLVEGSDPTDLPIRANFDLKATSVNDEKSSGYNVQISSMQIQVGDTELVVEGNIFDIANEPVLDLRINGKQEQIVGLLESARAFRFGPPKGTSASGIADIDISVGGKAKEYALNGEMRMRNLEFKGPDLPQAIAIAQLDLTFKPGEISSSAFNTTIGGGTAVNAAFSIVGYSTRPRLKLRVNTSNARLQELIRIAESFGYRAPPGFSASGNISLNATVDAPLSKEGGATSLNGSGTLSDVSIKTADLTQPVRASYAALDFAGDSAHLRDLKGAIGSSQFNGYLAVKNIDNPSINFKLGFDQIDLAELQSLIADNPQKSKSEPLRASGNLSAGRVVYDTLTVTDLTSNVDIANNVITLDPLSFAVYEGRQSGRAVIRTGGSVPDVSLTSNFTGVDINRFLTANSSLKNVIYGLANGKLDVRGSGRGYDQFVNSLNGSGNLSISDGMITSFDVEKQIETIAKLAGLSAAGKGTKFRNLSTVFHIASGRLTTEQMKVNMSGLHLEADGVMNLVDSVTTDYDLIARLNKELSGQLMPTGDAAFLVNTFFVDEKNRISVPLKMTGPLANPSFALNLQVLQANLGRTLQRRATKGVEEALENVLKGKQDQREQQKQGEEKKEKKPATTEDAIKSILEKLRRKPN